MTGERLTAPRLIAGIVAAGGTARHVARILNVTESAVCLWRHGIRTPSDLHLAELRRVYFLVGAHVSPARVVGVAA